tara:strand:- start:4966 stop:5196 length:231 start_codon:yes stop_codon:yes gene_type:complete
MSEKNLYENEDHIWQTHMKTLMQRKKSMEIAQTIDEALYQYYTVERELPVPNWRYIKDTDWWIQYLKDMGINPRNP